MNSHSRLFSGVSVFVGVIVAILALVRGPLLPVLLVAATGVWVLWMMLAVFLPSAGTGGKQRRPRRSRAQKSARADADVRSSVEQTLLRYTNHRISKCLQAEYPDARWDWEPLRPEKLAMEGGTGIIRVFGIPGHHYAEVTLDPRGNIQCKLTEPALASMPEENTPAAPNEQPVDPQIWYETQGRKVLEGLISDLNSRGHGSLTLGEDGSIHVDGGKERFAPLPGFPPKASWPQFTKTLERDGYAAEVRGDSIMVTW